MLKVGVIGATGYAGVELVRILSRHPGVQLVALASESYKGQPLDQVYPHLGPWGEQELVAPDAADLASRCDVVFLALPHGLAMEMAPRCLEAGARVIDLGADFRLSDASVFRAWYGLDHASPDLLAEAVYGLPEIRREAIARARLLANPGCYPTAASLGLLPLVEAGWLDIAAGIIIDAKSGVSGAGRSPSLKVHFAEVNENLRPYSLAGAHRHTPEIEQALSEAAAAKITVSFNPHLIPMTRGILATTYVRLEGARGLAEVHALYRDRYAAEPFVRVLEPGRLPETKYVYGSNYCFIGLALDERAGRLVIVSAIDNLVKGAAGQAVQNLNIMAGWGESAGLSFPAIYP